MDAHLIIDLTSLPEEGKSYSGQLPVSIFDLPAEDDAKAIDDLYYDIHAQRFGNELLLLGSLSSTFEFTCVRTLHPFNQTIHLENAAISIELKNEFEINVVEYLREEILINFPIDPRCEEGDEKMKCEIDSRYLSLDKVTNSEVEPAPRVESDDRWSALNSFRDHLKDQP